jgi:NADPH-dependent 7-cyano-7-deazaguanine reductase QueF-like protein
MSDRSYLATFLQSYVDSQQQVMAQITEDLHERTSECV